MITKPIRVLVSIAFCSAAAADASEPEPLFSDHGVLHASISAPFERIMRERDTDEDLPGLFRLQASDGQVLEFDIGLNARGEFRRRPSVCPFAPLQLNFRKKQVKGTVFAGQDKLKLVTHCESGSDLSEQAILREYLAYRILNVLTDISFRVRLLRITYEYDDKRGNAETRYGFLIEHKDGLAKRLDMTPLRVRAVTVLQLEPRYTNLTSVFQYLIGNTDFSPVQGQEGEHCCHNHSLFSNVDGTIWSVPYDFDLSGLANTKYARPNPRFKLRNVRDRKYRGRCHNETHLRSSLDHFHAKRTRIEALVTEQTWLSRSSRRSVTSYLESFYRTIGNDEKVGRELSRECIPGPHRGPATLPSPQ